MRRSFVAQAIGAGFLATLIMTLLAYAGPLVGLPQMDFAAMLGSMLTREAPAAWSGPWWAGMIWHFINGALIFPLIYAYVLYRVLPGRPWARGAVFAVILWALSMSLVAPMLGMGFFASQTTQPAAIVTFSLILHLIYGAVLGVVAGAPGAWTVRVEERERRAA